jgi:septal ring factor EnvC (AmiA/AmiB activator)
MALRSSDRLTRLQAAGCRRRAFGAAASLAEARTRSWRAKAGGLVLFLCLAVPLAAQQADRARTEAQARRATERLQALQREADRLAADERTLLNDLRRLEVERQIKAVEVKQADADAAAVEADLQTAATRMDAIQESDLASRPELRSRLVEMYKLGRARYLRLLLSTPDLRRIGQATRTVAALAKLDQDRIATYRQTLVELAAARTDLAARSLRLRAVRAEAARAEVAAQRAAKAKNDLVRDIDRRRDLNAQLSGELMGAQQKLQATLRSLASGTPVVDAPVLPFRPFKGDLDWPAAGVVRRRFGRTAGPGGSSSNGIEIAAEETARARAIHEGVVAFADSFAGFGRLVILDHGSQNFSLYGDLLEIAVKKGARVERGQAIGAVGPTATGAAGLYFELRVDGRPVDPLQWLRKR